MFSGAIEKMGFDPKGFTLMVLTNKKALSRENLLDSFSLSEAEKVAVDNRVKLFS